MSLFQRPQFFSFLVLRKFFLYFGPVDSGGRWVQALCSLLSLSIHDNTGGSKSIAIIVCHSAEQYSRWKSPDTADLFDNNPSPGPSERERGRKK